MAAGRRREAGNEANGARVIKARLVDQRQSPTWLERPMRALVKPLLFLGLIGTAAVAAPSGASAWGPVAFGFGAPYYGYSYPAYWGTYAYYPPYAYYRPYYHPYTYYRPYSYGFYGYRPSWGYRNYGFYGYRRPYWGYHRYGWYGGYRRPYYGYRHYGAYGYRPFGGYRHYGAYGRRF